ncbi:hypothetical protein BX600DRAFT_259877 [Xylariales sp. PMI_506]|nr:hypothetical protein BX600DRAFT_259877 [Xylariales sp. PMI_506]
MILQERTQTGIFCPARDIAKFWPCFSTVPQQISDAYPQAGNLAIQLSPIRDGPSSQIRKHSTGRSSSEGNKKLPPPNYSPPGSLSPYPCPLTLRFTVEEDCAVTVSCTGQANNSSPEEVPKRPPPSGPASGKERRKFFC